MTNLNRIATSGLSGAAILNVGLGGASCPRAIERTLRADVLTEALALLTEKIATEGYYTPWEWAGYNLGTSRREYEAAIAALVAEQESESGDASSEKTFGQVARRMHKREVLELCEKYSANRRGVQAIVLALSVAGGHATVRPGRLP